MDTITFVSFGQLQRQRQLKFKHTAPADALQKVRKMQILKFSLDKINMKLNPISVEESQHDNPDQQIIQEKLVWALSFVESIYLEEAEFFKTKKIYLSKLIFAFTSIKFHQLQYLNFKDCKLGTIEFLTFLDLPQLKRLILDQNDLTNLNSFAKCTFPKLYWVDLIENQIHDAKGLYRSRLGPKLGVLDVSQKKQLYNTSTFTYLGTWFFKLPFEFINYIRKKEAPFLFRRTQRDQSYKKYPDINFR